MDVFESVFILIYVSNAFISGPEYEYIHDHIMRNSAVICILLFKNKFINRGKCVNKIELTNDNGTIKYLNIKLTVRLN